MLTLDELRADPSVDTVIMAFTDMQGRLLGKRLHRDFFFEQVDHGHGTEGCNYLLALDMEMEPVPGYEIASWERGYGDFELVPDLATLRRIPWLEATAMVQCDVAWADGSPVRPSPRQVLRAQLERARAHGFDAMVGVGARVLFAARDVRGGAREGLPRPDAVGAVHPRLPHPRLDLRRAAAAPDPQRDARRGHARRDLEGRGVAGPAGDQLPLLRRADDGGQPRRLQERRQGDRASERLLDHVHGEARPHVDRLVVPHPLVAVARRRERVRRRERRLPAVPRGADRVRARAGGLLRAEHQLVQAVRGGLVGADDARLGPRQPDVRVPRRRARARRCAPRRGSRAAT